jgi:hypothetical protein
MAGAIVISHQHRCIFVHIPKCAGTSIEIALGHFDPHGPHRGMQDHRTYRQFQRPVPAAALMSLENIRHLRAIFYMRPTPNPKNHEWATSEQFKNYFKFAFIRNPWDRVYSAYLNLIRDPMHRRVLGIREQESIGLEDFLFRFSGKGMLAPQTYWLKSHNGRMELDFIGRFESLAEDFGTVAREIGEPNLALPHATKANSRATYQDAYSRSAREYVADFYSTEISYFGYRFD